MVLIGFWRFGGSGNRSKLDPWAAKTNVGPKTCILEAKISNLEAILASKRGLGTPKMVRGTSGMLRLCCGVSKLGGGAHQDRLTSILNR